MKTYTYIYNATSEDTARYAMDYPWGYKLRTEQRYWIEDSKRHGQRLVTQTKNPKTGRWCKPKKSTYDEITILTQDPENGHYGSESLSTHCDIVWINSFIERHKASFSDLQKFQAKSVLAFRAVIDKVKFEIKPSAIGPVSLTSQAPEDIEKRKAVFKEQEEREQARKVSMGHISRAMQNEFKSIQM